MVYERFVKQLDGCTYVSGGRNCTCACEAMWLYRASQGSIVISACDVRRQTGDTVGGTNLDQMVVVSAKHGITSGVLYRPTLFSTVRTLILSGRYGAIVQVGYSQIAGTAWDCFDGQFRGGHALYVSRGTDLYAHEGDPGADGRRSSIPLGYQNMPWAVLERAASALPLGNGLTLGQEYGSGHVYAYVTPADPIIPTQRYKVVISGKTYLYDHPNGNRVGAVSAATYICTKSKVSGLWWYQIKGTLTGKPTANAGRYFKPTRYTKVTLL